MKRRWQRSFFFGALIVAGVFSGIGASAARADQAHAILGHIQGNDASVETSTAGSDTIRSAESGADVSNGSIISVHTGTAHISLTSGGSVDVCGPAKLTLLQSGTAITLALNFGRVRVQLSPAVDLRIFTPTIVATPLDIHGSARDVTTGLDLDDSLCVTAGSGALLLENQFTGEKLVVPQGGEFSMARGQLIPVAGAAGSCECVTLETKEVIPPPEPSLGLTAPPHIDQPTNGAAGLAAAANAPQQSNVEYSVLAHANQVHPNSVQPKNAVPAPPAESSTEYKIVAPPLTFSASSPEAPAEPTPDMILLIRTVHVEPDWQFSGHVDAPPMDAKSEATTKPEAASNAVVPKPVAQINSQASQASPAAPASPPKKEGFWSKFKKFMKGGSS